MNAMTLQYQNMEKLKPRHHTILRLINSGMKQVDVARIIGMSQPALSCFLASPLATNELDRLRSESERGLVVNEYEIMQELKVAAAEAVRLNRLIMNDETTDVKVKVKIGMHFMDRVIFEKDDGDNDRQSYRDILRAVGRIEQKMDGSLVETTAIEVSEAGAGAD